MQAVQLSEMDDLAAREARPTGLARLAKSIPLPRGPQWYLIIYRWLVIAACLYTVAVTWNMWQVRSDPSWRAWSFGIPVNVNEWNHRPTDAELAPMLPVWDWLPQFPVGWLLVGSLLTILVLPRIGLASLFATMTAAVLMDQTRLAPHYMMAFLILATFPSAGAQIIGRVNLAALWFWAGFHKFIIDFIKPHDALGFAGDMIPNDLARFFPAEKYPWDPHVLHTVGVIVGWTIALTEMSVGLWCLMPPNLWKRLADAIAATRAGALSRFIRLIPSPAWIVAITALFLHAGVIWWNCWAPRGNLIGWNVVLAVAGFFLIVPWRNRLAMWRACRPAAKALAVLMFVYPATYYINWAPAYMSYCVYVPNNPCGELHRPGEVNRWIGGMVYEVTNLPLPPGQWVDEQYFNKIKRPGDVMVIHDPRPWARARGLDGRQLTYDGEFRDDKPYGHWVNRNAEGVIVSEGDIVDGKVSGHWTYWYPDGKTVLQEGNYVDGEPDGVWLWRTPDGQEARIEYDHGKLLTPAANPDEQ